MDYNDYLRLEIEVPTEGLPNLVQNPDGQAGAWGWLTPVNNTAMSTFNFLGTTALRFATHAAQAAHCSTENMPAVPGRWYGARYHFSQNEGSNGARARLEWLDSAGVVLSSSAQDTLKTTTGTYYYAAVQAPSGTAYVRLRFDMYTAAGATPAANTSILLRSVMVTHAATQADLNSTSRTNLVTNAGFNTDLTGWNTHGAGTRATDSPQQGTGYLKLTGSVFLTCSTTATVTGGKDYTLSGYVRSTTSTQVVLSAEWYDSTNKSVGVSTHTITGVGGSWKRGSLSATAPTAAVSVALSFSVSPPNGDYGTKVLGIDSVVIEEGLTLNPFYEGTYFYGANYDYSEPRDWRNILGPTYNIEIETQGLDVGLMNVNIKDALLDPAVSSTIRPGKQIRLLGKVDGTWTSRYTGRVSNAHVTYTRDAKGTQVTHINLSASDNISALANQGEARGIDSISALAFILEGKGVPWNINGSGHQLVNGTVVSYNENASVLDQIAITRDSNLGFAWVDRFGVINAWDRSVLAARPVAASFSDVGTGLSYTAIDVDFDIARCMNQVYVKWLRYNVGTGTTEEVTYGPYNNPTSQEAWGARQATFTKQGITEDPVAIQAFADSILTANANPTVKANSLTMPVRNAAEFKAAMTVDLFSRVAVAYDTKVDEEYFVSGIKHSITPQKWEVAYTFGEVSSVESPQWTPSPPFTGVTPFVAYSKRYRTVAGTWASNTDAVLGFNTGTETGAITYNASAGEWTVGLDGVYQISGNALFAANATGYRRLTVIAGGNVVAGEYVVPGSAQTASASVATCVPLAKGDTIRFIGLQNSGASLALNVGAAYFNTASVTLVSRI